MKRKAIILTFLYSVLCLSGCLASGHNEDEGLYCAPYIRQNIGKANEDIFFQIKNVLYQFNEKTGALSPCCSKKDCTHNSDLCTAYLASGIFLGADKEYLYTMRQDIHFYIDKVRRADDEKCGTIKISGKYTGGNAVLPVIKDGYCYFASNTEARIDGKVKLLKVSLNDAQVDAVPEAIWESEPLVQGDDFFEINQLQIIDKYLLFSVFSGSHSQENDVKNSLYVFNVQNGDLLIDGTIGARYAACDSGKLFYINEKNKNIEVYDIEQRSVIKLMDVENYTDEVRIACDKDYLYVDDSQGIFNTLQGEAPCIDVFDHSGKYVSRLDFSKASGENPEASADSLADVQYLCSTQDYIFCGDIALPGEASLYLVKKEQMKESNTVDITNMYYSNN